MSLFDKNKFFTIYKDSQQNEDTISKKDSEQKITREKYKFYTRTHEVFKKDYSFGLDWVWLSDNYYEWELEFFNFNTNYLHNFEWKILTRSDVIYENFEVKSNAYIILENQNDIYQTVKIRFSVFCDNEIEAKPVIIYKGLNKIITNKGIAGNTNYTLSSVGGGGGGGNMV
ncbi:MAG: hypothetical protein ACTSWG_10360 [Candidatus Helarchaeota archaeon]